MKLSGLLPIYIFIVLFSFSCSSSKDYLIESDYSYSGKFKKYKTYTFVKQADADKDPSIYNSIIEDAISYRMKLQGYKRSDSKPNLLVSYRIFFDDFEFMGYSQPNIEAWARTENEEEEYNPVEYDLKRGTLLVLLHDRKKRKVIWQGYAAGVFGNKEFDNDRYLKRAVRSVFDQYRFFAEGYMVNAKAPK
ncbi:DUF4136 domain-containing protein [Flammeovirgaceae bacterium SG7u.111]|nr:DUF4136 domain-containing protein [Flammeovirgaceae bacterium SG7u.132]WPO36732.1 DUF4136 domain-containing protein [Flammeovirgaceae bacterium SG7u.111]